MVIPIDNGTPAQRRRRAWGRNLTSTLDTRGITPKQLRQLLAAEGCKVSQAAIYQWLAGETAPTPERQVIIGHVLSVPASVIFPIVTES